MINRKRGKTFKGRVENKGGKAAPIVGLKKFFSAEATKGKKKCLGSDKLKEQASR